MLVTKVEFKKALFVLLTLSLFIPKLSDALPTLVPFISSPNPVGSGARAAGMGGAFIAVADDATASSWNPAGLIQLEKPEISVVGSSFYTYEGYDAPTVEFSDTTPSQHVILNFVSVAYPTKSAVFSLNFQHMYTLDAGVAYKHTASQGSRKVDTTGNYKQRGDIFAISPAVAFNILDNLSIGLTLNIFRDDLLWNNRLGSWQKDNVAVTRRGRTTNFITSESRRLDKMKGMNFNIGFLWEATRKLNLGFVFKTPFKASFVNERTFMGSKVGGNKAYITFPMSFGLGFAYRFTDNFSMSLDIYRTEWSQFLYEDGSTKESPITLKNPSESTVKPTHQLRMGGEYLFINSNYVIPIRFGGFFDPEPSEYSPETFWGFSVGSGVTLLEKVSVDFSYQFRRGSDVSENLLDVTGEGVYSTVSQHRVLLSTIFYF